MADYELRSVYRRFVKETWNIKGVFSEKAGAADDPWKRRRRWVNEMCVVRLHDAWARFCRDLLLWSARGDVLTIGSTYLTKSTAIPTIPMALKMAQGTPGVRMLGGEPPWHRAVECAKVAKHLTIQNYIVVSGALGSTPSPAEELMKVRNFVVHRRMNNWMKVRSSVSGGLPVSSAMDGYLEDGVQAGVPRLVSWIYQLRDIALSAAQ